MINTGLEPGSKRDWWLTGRMVYVPKWNLSNGTYNDDKLTSALPKEVKLKDMKALEKKASFFNSCSIR